MSTVTEKKVFDSTGPDDHDDQLDFELEIVDDTPEEDRGRPRRAKGTEPELPDDDEIAQYSEGVQKRIKQLKWEFHEERRAKEEAARLKDEAIRFAQQQSNELFTLRRVLSDGEKTLAENSKKGAEAQLAAAREKYRKAYDEGDGEAAADAMSEIAAVTAELRQWSNYRPQYQPVEAASPQPHFRNQVQNVQHQSPQQQVLDPKAVDWTKRNAWFGTDEPMTGYAMGLHEKLVKSGVHPQSDEYYQHIDEEMRRRFPDSFEDGGGFSRQTSRRQQGTVVAPATRSPKTPRKIQLTATQVALAKRLGLTPEQYAAELIKELQDG